LEILTLLMLIIILILIIMILKKTKNVPVTLSPRESFETQCKDIYKECSGSKPCCQGFKCIAISSDYSQCQSDPKQSQTCVAPYTECANAGKPCCGENNWYCDKQSNYSLCKPSGSSPPKPSPSHKTPEPSPSHKTPSPTPTTPPSPASKYYQGDQKATTTWFELEGGDDNGEGACGGCSLEKLYHDMSSIKTNGARWSLAATSSSMMNTSDRKASCDQKTGASGNTANAPCGSCWQLTRDDNGEKLNLIVADLCPNVDNKEWCASSAGDKNQHGSYNHFDIWNADQKHGLWKGEDNPTVTFQNIECPQDIKNIMKKPENSCCDNWGDKQGCPNICGPGYHL